MEVTHVRQRSDPQSQDDEAKQPAAPAIDAPAHPPAPPLKSASILALQRSAGNAAVARLLGGSSAPRRAVARFEAGEHARLGEDRLVKVNTVEMTEGDLIALADFYASVEDMNKAPVAELEALRDLIHQDRQHFERVPGVEAVTTKQWKDAKPDYLEPLGGQRGPLRTPQRRKRNGR